MWRSIYVYVSPYCYNRTKISCLTQYLTMRSLLNAFESIAYFQVSLQLCFHGEHSSLSILYCDFLHTLQSYFLKFTRCTNNFESCPFNWTFFCMAPFYMPHNQHSSFLLYFSFDKCFKMEPFFKPLFLQCS
jgi:hypothetical protein